MAKIDKEDYEVSREEFQNTIAKLSAANREMSVRNEQLNHWRKYADAIITTVREPLVVLDKDLRVKTANQSYYRMFQTTQLLTEGKLFYQLQNNQWDIPELRDLLDKNILEKTFYDSYRLAKKFSGIGERIMFLNVRRILSEGDNEQLILLAIEDVTEKETIDRKLKLNADYLKSVLESSPQIASTASSDGVELYFNQFFLDYSGLSFVQAVGLGWEGVVHPDMIEERKKLWTHSITTGQNFYTELLLKRHDGIYRWHSSRALAIRDVEGVITSWVGTASDVHDQKMFSEELEKKVLERTQSLKESNIDLEHSNKNLEQFAFIASHDLQEPLRKIRTFSNILSDQFSDKLPEKGKSLLNKIHVSTERMTNLIQDVLEFSRIDNSTGVFTRVNLNHILNNVMQDFNLLMQEKGASIIKSKLPVIEGISLQLTQLFNNLFSNALKFVTPGVSPVITIKSRQMLAEEVVVYPMLNHDMSYCEITFEDNGIGIEADYAEKVFVIFQRLHSREKFAGTGIGLALCKKIALNHHGEIFSQPKNTPGARFQIILPVKMVGDK